MAEQGPRDEEDAEQRAAFLLFLRKRGIRDTRVMRAMETVPRSLFVPTQIVEHAYSDRALPIACGQTISQPYLVAYMTEQLDVKDRHKVLEIGMGSGFQTAVLARLGRRIYTIDRYRTLVQDAENRLNALRITNVTSMVADGAAGWPAQAPFDRIMVTAAAESVPQTLVDQLADDGVMIIPVGPQGTDQRLLRITKIEGEVETRDLMRVRFVPMVAGRAVSL
ncbi:protein-L-isoaspartate(D-aspartate) O-methyltransferase [Flaviflagellibacter deserti]|jgi:protein-L-isoaspartate(D-aspartate) O-methyltransferase|uniref:Protein-L-isoaspartate O-methyltransferase n=1 Tax=Flaviflagellibacter deserti TaxID=2267266 RepID=A0ABV9Z178_9HYPH